MFEGHQDMSALMSKFKSHPPVLFLDETAIPEQSGTDREMGIRAMVLLRSIARCLQIIINFTGTDAKASNFCSKDLLGSGLKDDRIVRFNDWAVVFNAMPGYDSSLFQSRRSHILIKFPNSIVIKKILEFLEQVYCEESPWFIDLCFDYLDGLAKDDHQLTLSEHLPDMIQMIFESYCARKRFDSFYHDFNFAQVMYVCNFSWNPTVEIVRGDAKVKVLKSEPSAEGIIQRHMGHLFGYPDESDGPLFTLFNNYTSIAYKYTKEKRRPKARRAGNPRLIATEFMQHSVFPSFFDSPLTGLVFFGLDDEHDSLILENKYTRATTFHVLTQILAGGLSPAGVLNSGRQLELLAHVSLIQASRFGGPAGCHLLLFIGALVREMSPMVREGLDLVTPTIECSSDPYQRTLPLLSPMTVSSWGKPVFSLLETMLGPDQKPCLGVYKQSLKNERLDGVAYYQDDPDDTVEYELTGDLSVDAYKALVPHRVFETVNVPRKVRVIALKNDPPRCAFAIECKQEQQALCCARVTSIVTGKLKEYPDCPLLFFFALDFGPSVAELSIRGLSFWALEGDPPNSFRLVRLSRHGREKTCVILISLKVIWGPERYDKNEEALRNVFH
jgi:hypothetical protein